jgi:hypothetical protein
MSYIGKEPQIGNFQKCDAISVVNGQATYGLTVNSVAVFPESANHVLCSLNGILQAPTDSFTISSSNIVFASNLATGDVIDFVMILGNVLDLGVPSDNTVTASKLNNDIISGQTALTSEPADTDEFLVSDAGTIKRIDYSLIKGGGGLEFLHKETISNVANVDVDNVFSASYNAYKIIFISVTPATNNNDQRVRLIDSSGTVKTSSFYRSGSAGSEVFSASNNNSQSRAEFDTSYWQMLPGGSNTSNDSAYGGLVGEFTIYNPYSTTKRPQYAGHMQMQNQAGTGIHISNIQGIYNADTSTQFRGLRFYASSGNLSSGTILVYGIKEA